MAKCNQLTSLPVKGLINWKYTSLKQSIPTCRPGPYTIITHWLWLPLCGLRTSFEYLRFIAIRNVLDLGFDLDLVAVWPWV